jgi:hypothetical protein
MPEKQRVLLFLKLSLTSFFWKTGLFYSVIRFLSFRSSAINFQNKKRGQQKQQPKINLLRRNLKVISDESILPLMLYTIQGLFLLMTN